MKRFILSASATIIALLCSISCAKPLQGLDPKFPEIEGNEVNINPGELLSVKITLNDVRGNAIEAVAVSTNEAYGAKVTLATDGESGKVEIQAPAYILDETSFDVNVTVTDKANARTSKTTLKVKPIKSSYRDITDPANCFVATPGELVKFPACKGCSTEKVKFDKLSLLWQDIPGLVADIVVLDGGTNLVAFKEGLEGNAVIAAKDASGKVLWNWHFWVCADEIKDVVVGGVTFMDRNIGATIAQPKYEGKIITATTGLIYQWGRKDPFAPAETLDGFRTIYDKDGKEATAKIAACEVADNIQNAIENPDTWYNNVYPVSQGNYSWITNNVETVDKDKVAKLWDNNGAKTEYDPCPAGYKVAAQSDWAAAIGTTEAPTAYTEIFDDKYAPAQEVLDKWKSQSSGKYYDQYLKQSQFRGAKLGDMYVIGSGEVAHQHTINNTFGGSSQNVVSTIWSGTADPNIGTATAKSATYFRAYAVKLSYSYSSNKASFNAKNALNFAYGQPVRCVKVK